MAFEAHHFVGSPRESKRSWTKRHRDEARAEARARVAFMVTSVFNGRDVNEDLKLIKNDVRLVVYLDRMNVMSRSLFPYKKERVHYIGKVVGKMIDAGEIVIGQKGDFWLPSQVQAKVMLDKLQSEVETTGRTSLKAQAIAHQAEQERRSIENRSHPQAWSDVAFT